MAEPKVIQGPLPGQAVEAFRVSHGGALPGELQPCPFCGADEAAYRKDGRLHVVRCLHCGSQSPSTATEEGARTVWNSRASTSDILGKP
ncbi:MAG: Lar family restriction alleviation protein [Gemmatimonadales bacterium]